MNLRRVRAVCVKETIQILRDPRSLALGLVIPVILIVLFGYALSLDIKNVPMAVWDRDNTKTSFDFILNFKNSDYFKIVGYFDNYRDIEHLIDEGSINMALVLPKDFTHDIQSNRLTPVQLIIDGSDSNTAQISLGYVNNVVASYNQNKMTNALKVAGIANSLPVDMKQRVWFNQDFQSKFFIVPGLIAIIMMIIAALLTSLTIAREWERGTMEQLISTPVKSFELVAGKFIPYFAIGIIDLIIAVILGRFVFEVPIRGSLFTLFFLSSIFLAGSLSLGIYISIVSRSQLMASQLAILTSFLPTFLLSGFTYEIFNMPKWVQGITYLIPARYFIIILRGIFLKDVGMRVLWPETLCLIAFGFIAVWAAVRKFKKKIPEIK